MHIAAGMKHVLSDWMTSSTWCCFLSLTKSFLKSPVLDIFTSADIDVDFEYLVRGVGRPVFTTQLLMPDSLEDTFVPIREAETDTVLLAHSLPSLYFTGHHGRVVFLTDNITTAKPLWTKHRLLEIVIIHIGDTQVDAYSWFPYRLDQCHREPDITLLSSCNENCTWNVHLFPEKLPKHFGGCPLRFDCFHYPPNVYKNADGTFRGREVTFMETLAKSFGFSVAYAPDDNSFFLLVDAGGKPTGAMGTILRGEADFAYSTLVMQGSYAQFCQVLPSYRESLVVWMLPTPNPKPLMYNIFSGFSLTMWSLILSTMLGVTVTVGGLAYFKSDRWLWIDVLAVTVASPVTTNSQCWLLRLFILCTQLYSLHIVWFYQSTLLRNLFSIPMEKQLVTLAEAVDAGLVALLRGFMKNTFNNTDHELWDKMLAEGGSIIGTEFDYHLVVEEKSAFMMAMEVNDRVDLRKAYPNLSLPEMVYTVKEPFANFPVTVYGRRGSPLTERFSGQMLHLIESGIFYYLTDREPDFQPFVASEVKTKRAISFEMLQTVFYLIFSLLITGFMIFLIEILTAYRPWQRHKRNGETRARRANFLVKS